MNISNKQTFNFFLVLLLSFTTGISKAEDTEIYFNANINANVADNPNLLFILDTSGSMDDPISTTDSQMRLTVLKNAMGEILSELDNVNVGLMRFHFLKGGPVLFPIADINSPASVVASEPDDATTRSFTYTITNGDNDAHEYLTDRNSDGMRNKVFVAETSSRAVNEPDKTDTTTCPAPGVDDFEGGTPSETYVTNDSRQRVERVRIGGVRTNVTSVFRTQSEIHFNRRNNRHEALRFIGIEVPPNARIDDAYLTLTTDARQYGTGRGYIHAIEADDVADSLFDSCSGTNITECDAFSSNVQDLTDAREQFSVSTYNRNDTAVRSPNLKDVITEVTSRGCTGEAGSKDTTGCTWNTTGTNGTIALVIKDFTDSTKQFQNTNSTSNQAKHPKLTIEWSTKIDGPTCTPTSTTTLGNNILTGLRFQNIAVPQGATITSASLELEPSIDETAVASSTLDAVDLTIRGELADNTSSFSSADSHLSNRFAAATTTAKENWSIPAGTPDNWNSPNIKSVIEEIVGQANWCGGNALTLFLSGTDNTISSTTGLGGAGTRSFDLSESGTSPRLKIEYELNSSTGSGCNLFTEVNSVARGDDDTEHTISNKDNDLRSTTLNMNTNSSIGIRFSNVDIPPGSTITEAKITFRAHGNSQSNEDAASMKIFAEDAANAGPLNDDDNHLFDRTYFNTSFNWSPEAWDSSGSSYDTANFASVLQNVISRPSWASGNSLNIRIDTDSGSREAKSYNSGNGPILSVVYQGSDSSSFVTVRDRLIEQVNALPAYGGTPIVGTMYEAAQYWRGDDMIYGNTRGVGGSSSAGTETGDGRRHSRLSHPGSYCTKDPTTGVVNCGNADTGSSATDSFGVYYPSGCSNANLSSSNCQNQAVRAQSGGTVKYVSPFKSDSECAANYQVLLTDGKASDSGNTPDAVTRIDNEYITDGSCRTSFTHDSGTQSISGNTEKCAIDLAEHLFENDLDTVNIDDKQNVSTYTVAFALDDNNSKRWLTEIASKGGGKYKEANSASELIEVFTQIIDDVRDDPTSFASPALSTNAFNTLFSRDEVYFGLFSPDTRSAWNGNVKKFTVCTARNVDSSDNVPDQCDFIGRILDKNGNHAVGDDNRFSSDSVSFWTDVNSLPDGLSGDGVETLEGGVGAVLDDFTDRIIYTDTTSSGSAPNLGTQLNVTAGHKITSNNWDSSSLGTVRNLVCTDASDLSSGSECEDSMLWMLGKVIDEEVSDVDSDSRWVINDVLHSSPTLITYGGNESTGTFYDKLIFASNSGALHFVNATDNSGKEEWAFIPETNLRDQDALFDNNTGDHISTMDLTPVIRRCDGNRDGTIDPTSNDGCDANQDGTGGGDFIHVIAGQRRGGKNLYALDISGNAALTSTSDNSIEPKFLWRIEGGVPGDFENLSNTWSKPVLTTINVLDTSVTPNVNKDMDVLIFGGGYDTNNDNTFGASGEITPASSTNDNSGNVIYVVDPYDGSLIFSIGGSGTNADIKIPDMHHSIPSEIGILDSDADGDTDRLYFGDTAGQVWRVDLADNINPNSGSSPQGDTVVGKLASISSTGGTPTGVNQRRFFERPSIVQVYDTQFSTNSEYDYILLGSGNRSNPLDKNTEDYFFAFRDYQIGPMTKASGSHLAVNYPQNSAGNGTVITTGDMIDVSNDLLGDLATANADAIKASEGWYINFSTITTDATERDGEKILSPATTLFGTTFFTSYSPSKTVDNNSTSGNTCLAQIGGGSLYAINVLNTVGYFTNSVDGREHSSSLGGIASAVIPLFTEDGVFGIVGTEGGALQVDEDGNTTELQLGAQNRGRTYWYEY